MSALSKALNDANVNGWSAAEIARRSGGLIHRATAADVLRGKHAKQPSDDVLRAFSVVFPTLSLQKLRVLAGLPAGEAEPYRPPPEANRLDSRQRRAVDELIRLLAEAREAGGADLASVEEQGEDDRIEPNVTDVLVARRRRLEEAEKVIDTGFPKVALTYGVGPTIVAGTGSGKTESFLLPLLARLKQPPSDWDHALGELAEMYAQSQIDRDALVGAVEEARELAMAGASGSVPLAARPGIRQRSITDEAQNEAGHENQDSGGMEPS